MNIVEFISKYFPNAIQEGNNTFKAICPTHPDHKPSLSITEKNGHILLNCPVCSMNKAEHDIKMRELANTFPNPNEFWKDLLGNQPYNIEHKFKMLNYTLDDYVREKKLNRDFLIQCGCKTKHWIGKSGKETTIDCVEIPYYSIEKKYVQSRYRVFPESDNKSKVWDKAGNQNMIYGLWLIPDFANNINAEYPDTTPYLIVVEGESDCHTLWSMGYSAIGISGCKKITDIDKAFQDQGISNYIDKFKVIYLVIEDDDGRKGFYPPFRKCTFYNKVRCIQFRNDIELKSKGTPNDSKDPSELYCALNGDVQAFYSRMNDVFSMSIPIENYPFPQEQPAFKMEDKEDKRKITSPQNGKKGGRPPTSTDYTELAEYFMQFDEIKKYKQYEGRFYRWSITENRYIETTEKDFEATVMGLLQQLHIAGDLYENFNISNVSIGTKKSVIGQLLSKRFIVIDSETTKENHYINNPDDKLYKALGNGIIDIRGIAKELNNHWDNRNIIEQDKYFFNKSTNFFNLSSLDSVSFDINADCPETDKILHQLLQDEEMIKAYWELIAIALLDDYKPNKLYMFYGQSGTGKTTVGLGIIESIFGNSSIRLKWNDLNPEDSKFKVSALTERNTALIDELPTRLSKIDTIISFIKDITNGNNLTTEKKGQNPKSAPAKALLIFATNTLALLYQSAKINELAIFDRVIPILFETRVRDTEKEDKEICNIFKAELSGILNKALKVLGNLIENHYKMSLPAKSRVILESFKLHSKNQFDIFIEDCCFIDTDTKHSLTILYEYFKRYMDELKEQRVMSYSDFQATIITKGFQWRVDQDTKTRYTNIKCTKYNITSNADTSDIPNNEKDEVPF